jgi:hypothetical protein
LNSTDDLLDFLSVFLFHLFYKAECSVSPAPHMRLLYPAASSLQFSYI